MDRFNFDYGVKSDEYYREKDRLCKEVFKANEKLLSLKKQKDIIESRIEDVEEELKELEQELAEL